jgi:ABC-type Mn2+/Zn2+ transport system ATPase subunit
MPSYGGRACITAIPEAPAFEARCVTARYAGAERLALDCVSLIVPVGQRVALVGPNGAGKSSLLKAASGLLKIQSGTLSVYGSAPALCDHRVAYLAQRGEIDWRFPVTLRKLVLTGRYAHLGWFRRAGAADWAAADAAIARMNLSGLAERQIGELSGGQQQRALLARALAQDADLLLLDEPLTAVDADTRAIVSSTLHDLQQQGKTVIIATHDIDRLEHEYDQVLYLVDGRQTTVDSGQRKEDSRLLADLDQLTQRHAPPAVLRPPSSAQS